MEDQVIDVISQLNQFDWVVLGVVAISSAYGLLRGFAREVTSFLGWVGAFFLANTLALPVSETMAELIDTRTTRYLMAWGLIFIAVVFFFGSVGRWLSNQMRQPGFNFGNRLLGAAFGAGRGIVIASVLTIVLRAMLPASENDLLRNAEFIEPLDTVADWLADNFDEVLEADAESIVDSELTDGSLL